MADKLLILKDEIYGNCPTCKTLLHWPISYKVDPAHWSADPGIVYCPICLKNVDLRDKGRTMEAATVSHYDLVQSWVKCHHPKGFVVVANVEYGNDNFYNRMEEFAELGDIITANICVCGFGDKKDAAFNFIDKILDENIVGCYATLWEDGVIIHENT